MSDIVKQVEVDKTTTTNNKNGSTIVRPKSRGISDFTSPLEFIGKTKSNKSASAKQTTPNSPSLSETTPVKSGSTTSTVIMTLDRVANPYIDVIYKRLRTLKKRLVSYLLLLGVVVVIVTNIVVIYL